MSLKLELDSRPTQEDFDVKLQQCNDLRLELSNLTEQMACNEKLLEQMQADLNAEREMRMKMLEKCLIEREMQTDDVSSTKEDVEEEVDDACSSTSSSVLSTATTIAPTEIKSEEISSIKSTELPQSLSSPPSATLGSQYENIHEDDDDDALNNHPKVLYEDELIVFKEKCTNLTAERVRLQREIGELRANMSHFHNTWLHNFMLKYLVPVLICFVAYIFYLLK